MSEVLIQSCRLDPDGRLRLRPAEPSSYNHIYRSTSSVRWDESARELYVLEVRGFDAVAEFKQIIAAVSAEYGDRLAFSPSTKYLGIQPDVAAAIQESAG